MSQSIDTESKNSTITAKSVTTERVRTETIDVDGVLRAFQPTSIDSAGVDYGDDLQVVRVRGDERQVIAVAGCPNCQATTAYPRYQLAGVPYQMVVCSDCELGALHPRPTASELNSFYPANYYGSPGAKFTSAIETAVRWAASYRVRQFLRGIPSGGRLLDVGCGRGVALKTVADRGYEAHGFEISETAATGIDPRVQLHLGSELAEVALPDGHFDLVMVWHVLEHLPNPKETLREIQRILKPGGRIAVAVPNTASWQAKLFGPAWFHLDLPRHLFHFTPQALRSLLTNAGFDCERVHHFSVRQNPFGWVQSALNALSPTHRNALYALLKSRKSFADAVPSRMHRWLNKAAYWFGMPVAGAMSLLAAACRSGGTICITARKAPQD